jgi:hypothetical protein
MGVSDMNGQQYIRDVFKSTLNTARETPQLPDGAFLATAIEMLKEVESPLKEETLVRLALLQIERVNEERAQARRCA